MTCPRRGDRGSALLIVFVFAAMVAIMLYAELPIAVFEAKRQKEQLLIDRGHEYAHAVKLYVRKFGTYPASIDQLEDTNRMRFLRHRFKDPFTGKDDWRLLHAGPGGMLIDSKVNPLGQNQAGNGPNQAGTGPGFSSNSSFGSVFGTTGTNTSSASTQAGFGSSSESSSGDTVVVPPVPQRPPAISANGAPSANEASTETGAAASEGDQSPTTPLLTPAQTDQIAGNVTETSAQSTAAPSGQNNSAGGTQPGQNALNAPGTAPGGNAVSPFNNRPPQTLLAGSTGSPMGQINSGGIAGVASKAKGQSIKTVNDQTDYSLWEFYYDPSKDSMRGAPGQGFSGVQPGIAGNGITAGVQTQSVFGQNSNTQTAPGSSFTVTSTGAANSGTATSNPPQQ